MKNAHVYKAALPRAADLEAHLVERPWRPLLSGERVRHAFVEGNNGRRVQTFPGGYAIRLRTDAKVLPATVINTEVDRRTKQVEQEHGTQLDREQRAEIKEAVLTELLAKALVTQRYTTAYYDAVEQLLFVDTSTPKVADAVMNELVQCCASVKTETLNVADLRMGVTTRLQQTIEDGASHFGEFDIGSSLNLNRKSPGEPLERVTYTECDIATDEVLHQIRRGFRVESLELCHQGVYFRLTDKFRLKRFQWPDLEGPEDVEAIERWEHDTSQQVILARGIVMELCRLLEYQPPSLEDAA